MKRYIVVSDTERERLVRVYKVNARTVYNALTYSSDKGRGFTDTAKRIREDALRHGGIIMNGDCVEMETLHFHDKTIVQVFPADREIRISGDKARLYKQGKLIKENKDPFVGYQKEANHIGDIDIYNNELYVSSEWFDAGVGKNIQIAIHDPETLALKRSVDFNPESGQVEVSGITVDTVHNSVWMASWVGEESGRYLYEYDLSTGKYKRKVHLQPVPQWIQGVYAYNGDLYVTSDDGTADEKEPDHIYRVEISDKNNEARVVLEKTLNDIRDVGEVEGLNVNPKTKQLLVHANRGKQIVLGMPKGFYPGYDREISEIYFYDMKPRCNK